MQFTHHQLVSIWLSVIELKQHIHQHTNHLANNVRWQTLQVKKKNIIIKQKNNNKLEEKRRKKYIYKVKNPAYRRHWIFQCLRIVTPIPNNPKKNRKKKLSSVMCHVSQVTWHLSPDHHGTTLCSFTCCSITFSSQKSIKLAPAVKKTSQYRKRLPKYSLAVCWES